MEVLKRIAIFGMALMFMATLLWGGCVSCPQFFMFPFGAEKICCKTLGTCGQAPSSNKASAEQCRIQPAALAVAPALPQHVSVLLPWHLIVPCDTHNSRWKLQFGTRRQVLFFIQGSPPDLRLLHSVFRI
jgi:hypothetical protein